MSDNFFKDPVKSNNFNLEFKQSDQSLYAALDLDETLVSRFWHHDAKRIAETIEKLFSQPEQIIQLQTQVFFNMQQQIVHTVLHPGCLEFLAFCHQLTNNHVFIFTSAQNPDDLQEKTMRTIYSLLSLHLEVNLDYPRVFNRKHCNMKHMHWRKNLAHIADIENTRIENIFLVDNQQSCAFHGQEKNLLHAKTATLLDFRCDSPAAFRRINHLFYVAGLIHAVLRKGKNFVENLNILQNEITDNHSIEWKFYLNGLTLLRNFNPDLNFYTNGQPLEDLVDNHASSERTFSICMR